MFVNLDGKMPLCFVSHQPICCCCNLSHKYSKEMKDSQIPTSISIIFIGFSFIATILMCLGLFHNESSSDRIKDASISFVALTLTSAVYSILCCCRRLIDCKITTIIAIISIGVQILGILLMLSSNSNNNNNQAERSPWKHVAGVNPPYADCLIERNDLIRQEILFKYNETYLVGPYKSGKSTYIKQLYHKEENISRVVGISLKQLLKDNQNIEKFIYDDIRSLDQLNKIRIQFADINQKDEYKIIYVINQDEDTQFLQFIHQVSEIVAYVDYMSLQLTNKYKDCAIQHFQNQTMVHAIEQLSKINDFNKIRHLLQAKLANDPDELSLCFGTYRGTHLTNCQNYKYLTDKYAQLFEVNYGAQVYTHYQTFLGIPKLLRQSAFIIKIYDSVSNIRIVNSRFYNYFISAAKAQCNDWTIKNSIKVYEPPCY